MNRDERNELVMLLELGPKIMVMDPRNAQMLKDAAAEIRRLVEGLEMYANPEFYHGCGFLFDRPTGGFDEDFSDDHGHDGYDRPMPGKLARKLLEGDDGKD